MMPWPMANDDSMDDGTVGPGCRFAFTFGAAAAARASTRVPGQTVRLSTSLSGLRRRGRPRLPLADDIDPKGNCNSTLRELGLLVTVLTLLPSDGSWMLRACDVQGSRSA